MKGAELVRNSYFWKVYKRKFAVILLLGLPLSWNSSHAAVLDGMMGGVEESLEVRVSKKGEKLTVGNFYTAERPDAHAPIGVMGDHTHNEGEFMFSYRYMQMYMGHNQNGTTDLSVGDVLQQFMIAPTEMTTKMHMFSSMLGFNKTVTLMAMLPYVSKSMNHQTRSGQTFTTDAEGFGDIKLSSLWRLYAVSAPSIGTHRLVFNFGLSLPTGSITETDQTPMSPPESILPFPMQLGAGTVNILPGLLYGGETERISWGLQAVGDLPIGENKRGWAVGDSYFVNGWGAYRWTNWLSTSARLNWQWKANYDGRDPATNPNMIQTANPELQGGQRLNALGGINILFPEWMEVENRLAIEFGGPIYQYLNGPQLGLDWVLFAGYQFVK